jgi:hypothetical protein
VRRVEKRGIKEGGIKIRIRIKVRRGKEDGLERNKKDQKDERDRKERRNKAETLNRSEPRYWELKIENLSFVILCSCVVASKSAAGSWERGVRIAATMEGAAVRQRRLQLRPGKRFRAMNKFVLTRPS